MLNNPPSNRFFLSCDWGTTSFRISLAEIDSGRTVAGISGSDGIKRIYYQWNKGTNPSGRIAFYETFLNRYITGLEDEVQYTLRGLPLMISGMASSSIGLQELPYHPLPFSLKNPDLYIERIDAIQSLSGPVCLISGVRSEEDVMRGEETQVLGLAAKTDFRNGLYLLPGTHSKHIILQDGAVTGFKTFMTGEIFQLMASQSILSSSVSLEEHHHTPGPGFSRGISASADENLLHSLFTIRAADLLDSTPPVEHYDFLSGLLIGVELADIEKDRDAPVIIQSSGNLNSYYIAAMELMDIPFIQVGFAPDENPVTFGHHHLLRKLEI